MSLSSIVISGTVKKNPEKRFTPTNIPVANIIIEISYVPRGSQQTEGLSSQTVRVNAWRDLAEHCEKNLKTGDKVLVIGRAQINAYTTNDGKKKRELEIDANAITLLNDVISIVMPKTTEKTEKEEDTFKKTSQDLDQVSTLEEAFSSSEEIPF